MRWPADNQRALIAFYGTPGPEVERQLVDVIPPFKMYYRDERKDSNGKLVVKNVPVTKIRFHRKAAAALTAALNEIWEKSGRSQALLDREGISQFGGAYNPRFVRGSKTKWSNHAYAAAIDLDAKDNGFGAGKGDLPQFVIDAFKRQGARWGGDYRGRTDPMHFEFCDANAAPVGFADLQTDGDSDSETSVVTVGGDTDTNETEIQNSAESDAEPRVSWLRRKWRGVTGWFSGVGGVGVLGYLTDPWVIVAIGALFVVIVVAFILFMGPGDVRAWIRKQVS